MQFCKRFVLFCILILIARTGWSQEFKLLTPPILDLGRVPADTIVSGVIRFVNDGDKPLRIKKIQTSCGCTVVKPKKLVFAPKETGELPIQFDTRGYSGVTRKTITIYLEEGNPSRIRVVLQSYVIPKIEVEPRFLKFQNISVNMEPVEKTFEVRNNTKYGVKATIKVNSQKNITIEPSEVFLKPKSSQTILVSYKPLKKGRDDTAVLIEINSPFKIIKRIPVFINVIE